MKIIIVGGGQIGSYVARSLLAEHHQVLVIEQREDVFAHLQSEFSEEQLLFASGSDPAALEAAGIQTADVVAAVTGLDEVNLVISTLAKMEFGVPKVVARINNPKNEWLFTPMMGVDKCVNQAALMAHQIVDEDILEHHSE